MGTEPRAVSGKGESSRLVVVPAVRASRWSKGKEGDRRRQKETEDEELLRLIGVYIVGKGPVFVFCAGMSAVSSLLCLLWWSECIL